MSSTISSEDISSFEKQENLPLNSQSFPKHRYKIKEETEASVSANDSDVHYSLWFKTPPLTEGLINHLNSIQLVAESHDQGAADDVDKGLWTWFELVLFEDEKTTETIKDGDVELAWRSHRNSPLSEEFTWNQGKTFSIDSDLLRFLNAGNVIGVRLCARFPGWELSARQAFLLFDFAKDTTDRVPPPQYSKIVAQVDLIQTAIDQVNQNINTSFTPKISKRVTVQADALKSDKDTPLCVLSLDGGGVRGLSTLLILQAVLNKAAIGKKPYEIFDLIGGTSTGGLIAIMLGRLMMSIEDCIASYKQVMGTVFVNKAPLWSIAGTDFFDRGYFYDSAPLEKAVKNAIKTAKINPEAALYDANSKDGTKVFVLAVRKQGPDNRAPVFLRSYINPLKEPSLPQVKVWEAARATSAAPAYFPSIKVGDTDLVDGGLAANNPLGWLWTEVATVFTPGRSTDCFLSIGTGVPPNAPLVDPIFKVLHPIQGAQSLLNFGSSIAGAATNSESTNVLFRVLLNQFAPKAEVNKYFRLNFEEIIRSTDPSKLDDFVKLADMDDASQASIQFMENKTKEWISQNGALIDQAALSLKQSHAARAANK